MHWTVGNDCTEAREGKSKDTMMPIFFFKGKKVLMSCPGLEKYAIMMSRNFAPNVRQRFAASLKYYREVTVLTVT